jgi:hypothetical protein
MNANGFENGSDDGGDAEAIATSIVKSSSVVRGSGNGAAATATGSDGGAGARVEERESESAASCGRHDDQAKAISRVSSIQLRVHSCPTPSA